MAASSDCPGIAIEALSVAAAALADSDKATLKRKVEQLKLDIREQQRYQANLARSVASLHNSYTQAVHDLTRVSEELTNARTEAIGLNDEVWFSSRSYPKSELKQLSEGMR